MSLRDLVLQQRLTIEPFPTPEWPDLNGQVHIRELTAEEFNRAVFVLDTEDPAFLAQFAIMALCEKDGTPIFTDADLPQAVRLSGNLLKRAGIECQKLSGMRGDPSKNVESK